MQYTYWPISQEVKAIRQCVTFFFKKIIHKIRWRYYSQSLLSKLNISLDHYSKVSYRLLLCNAKLRTTRTLKLSCRPLAFTSYKALLENKMCGTSLPVSFSAWFLRKAFLYLYSTIWPNFIVWLPLLCEILSNMWHVTVC